MDGTPITSMPPGACSPGHAACWNPSGGPAVQGAMRRTLAIMMAALVLVTGCARRGGPAPTAVAPAGISEAEVYEQVLRRYLSTPSENSFPEKTFQTVYVFDQTEVDAGEPKDGNQPKQPSAPITADVQSQVVAAFAATTKLTFVADKASVLINKDGCAQVKDGAILITLGPIDGDGNEVEVGINGFVACLGATWLTYVVHNPTGTGWTVKGTTGSMTIS
jgi:hypothetical protein